jgi:hypothetical protein
MATTAAESLSKDAIPVASIKTTEYHSALAYE